VEIVSLMRNIAHLAGARNSVRPIDNGHCGIPRQDEA
jgi:hypothetical protein